jgi:FkbH-like protein
MPTTVLAPAHHGTLASRAMELLGGAANADTSQWLIAAASLAPAALLRLVVDESSAAADAVSPAQLSTAIAQALRAFDGDAAERRLLASAVVTVYADVLTLPAVLASLEALGRILPDESEAFERVRRRFPADPAILRTAAKLDAALGDHARLDATLNTLGSVDPAPGTMAFISRERPKPAADARTVRAALLSSFTIDPLVPYIDHACRTIGLVPQIQVAPFNSWTREVIDDGSALRRSNPEIVFLSVAIDDLVPELAGPLDAEELRAAGASALERVLVVARTFASWAAGVPLVVHSFHSAYADTLGVLDSRDAASRRAWLARLNLQLVEELRALPSCYVLDVPAAVASAGGSLRDNAKVRHLAAMRLPPEALPGIAHAYACYIAPLKGLTRKCVVVDLDNTLWGGVVGEDLKESLRLGHTSPGAEFVEFQEYLRTLPARGILLAVNSKNNPDDALDVIRTHEAMVLREANFSALRINWTSKPDNMMSIAQELGIGVDSLVFVDDNPDERERMRQLLPAVLTVELPKDPALYRSALERLPQLQTLAVTDEDRARAEQYRTARLREETKLSAASVEEYLTSLEIEVTIARATQPVFARIVQLFARTNQFNTTTRRYSAADVAAFADDPLAKLWAVWSKDRFGDHGLVALALVRAEGSAWTIDSFLMSCRVIGYGIESTLLAHVARQAASIPVELRAEFIPTKKNAPAEDLFARHGFEMIDAVDGVQRWQAPGTVPYPIWVKVTDDDA